jgi:hypothetical protein
VATLAVTEAETAGQSITLDFLNFPTSGTTKKWKLFPKLNVFYT